jgi:hypothetical protein
MHLDTQNTLYVCTDRTNDEVKLLLPRRFKELNLEVAQLNLADPSPECTDADEYRLLATEMEELRFDL